MSKLLLAKSVKATVQSHTNFYAELDLSAAASRPDLGTRFAVTSSVFNFSTRLFAQIVENRETQLSSLFLGSGDTFSKSYDENRFVWQLYGT